MRIKKGYLIIGAILLVALFIGIFNDKELTAKQTPIFTDKNIYETDIIKSWETFKKEYKISDQAKIDDVSIVLNNQGDFESVKFNLVEKKGNKYKSIHHQSCVSCPNLQDDDNTVWTETSSDWAAYSKIIDADTFFAKLQFLNQNMKFTENKLNVFFQIRTREWSDTISLPGDYFILGENQIDRVKAPSDKVSYMGYNLQVIEGDSVNFHSDENTKNIIIDQKE
ncbi:MAG TPA: hypothetical protein VEV44_03270 [Pseudoneobacillus sp.]|nr:hypothetical protein [Pseudoneobacillus sp.]